MANFFQATKKKKTIGTTPTLTIERLDLNGCGVAKLNNKPVFIEQTLAGERIKCKIVEEKSKYLRGKIISIDLASNKRIPPLCEHYRLCGGCDLQHYDYEEHLRFKQHKVSTLFQRNDIKQTLPWQEAVVGEAWYYRRKARIGVQYDKQGQVTLGFRQRATNQLVAIKKCQVLEHGIDDIFTPLKNVIKGLSLSRSIGHVEVIKTDQTTLVIRQLKKLNQQDIAHWLEASKAQQWQILFDDSNNITALTALIESNANIDSKIDVRDKGLSYQLPGDIMINFEADDFIQINHSINQKMVTQALDWLSLKSTDTVLDLFCGLGNFSLSIAQSVKKLVGIEGVQTMVDRAAGNAAANHLPNCEFFQADLNANWIGQNWAKQHFDKVLLDPARAGAYQAIEQLIKFDIATILYVSCDPSTLAKDASLLTASGYRLEKIALIEMFSQTKHVETMVLFSKN